MKKLDTCNYKQKKIVNKIFGRRYANELRRLKMIFLYKLGINYDLDDLYKIIFKEGDFVFDIGANIGQSACRFSRLVKEKGCVFSFEPVQDNYSLLIKTKKSLKLNNVSTYQIALGNKNGTAEIYIPSFNNSNIEVATRASVLHKPGEFENAHFRVETISIMTLDQFIDQHNVDKIDLIKSDTEGNDIKVIEGAIHSIKKYKPVLILETEFNADIFKKYLEMGYHFYYYYNSKLISAIDSESAYSDLILIPETRIKTIQHLLNN